MGIPVPPPPPEYGDDEIICFPDLGTTPFIMHAVLTGIIKGPCWEPGCPNPPNGLFTLRQNEGQPFRWECYIGIWWFYYFAYTMMPAGFTHINVRTVEGPLHRAFWSLTEGICLTQLPNTMPDPETAEYIDGNCSLWF